MGNEKRKYKRLPMKLDLLCSKIGSETDKFYNGQTLNVSPGGLYFEITDHEFETGNMVRIDLSIPPTVGLLEYGGRICGFAKVKRIGKVEEMVPCARHGVALEFCGTPKLWT